MSRRARDAGFVLAALAVATLPCCSRRRERSAESQIRERPNVPFDPHAPGWLPENRARIERLMAERGRGSTTFDPAHPPVAVFDWDNTMMRGDIGDATFSWMLRHDKILQPPDRDWSKTNRDLTAAGLRSLGACHDLAEPGRPLPTSREVPCAQALQSVYDRGLTPEGAPAWQHETTPTMHQSYAWGVQLQAGYTPEEVRGFARAAYEEYAAAPVEPPPRAVVHPQSERYVRIYPEMRELTTSLRHAGFDVWVISASSQYLVDVVGEVAGFPRDHLVGVRTLLEPDGRAGYRITGCGTEPDGADTIITFDQGKRCWINRAVFHRPPEAQLQRASDPALRPVFAAGDSDTDLAMLQDATGLKLAIDRNKPLLMCNALRNAGGRWLVQPMFFDAIPPHVLPYRCPSLRDHGGGDLLDEDGNPIPLEFPNGPPDD